MHTFIKQFTLTTLLAASLLLAATYSHAQNPTAVGLIYFTGQSAPEGVRLEWATGSEMGTAGFVVERSSGSGASNFVELTSLNQPNGQPFLDAFVDAQGDVALGADYVAIDPTAVTGQTYTYRLVEIETNGTRNPLIPPATVTAGATATPSPVPIGSNPTSNPNTNLTATATPSATATNGSSSTTTATAVPPTNTPSGRTFITPTPSPAPTQATDNNTNTQPPAANPPTAQPTAPPPGVALAQAEETPTTSYPEPGAEVAPPPTTELPTGYEGEQPFVPATTPTAYPENFVTPTSQPTPTIIAIIGSDSSVSPETAVTNPTTPNSNSALLWLAFIAALIVLIIAVIAVIKLFTRKQA